MGHVLAARFQSFDKARLHKHRVVKILSIVEELTNLPQFRQRLLALDELDRLKVVQQARQDIDIAQCFQGLRVVT